MNNCRTLFDYARFVDKVREFHAKGCNHAEAVDQAVTYCIENDILREFLAKNRSEVCYMFDTDYSEKKFWEMKKYNYEKALQEKDSVIAEKDDVLAEKDEEIARQKEEIIQLKKQLAKSNE